MIPPIPQILLRLLPYGLAALALLGAVLWIDHQGYSRAKHDAERQNLVTALIVKKLVDKSEQRMIEAVSRADTSAGDTIRQIETVNRTIIQPTITREIQNAPRLSDPALGITDVLRLAINQVLALGPDPTDPAGSVTIELPEGQPAPDE